ncbi:conserved hypothetical protein [Shewanella halifaxensis HAW-EB4]|uniref:Uncharacterized protein n=1 Tax=Shewanella halifaxensis (strain HAW-EB4) TaxID=458817 RepID=B0TRC9_SHEHH|nr:hypothetical protein [Shewanella halifaxensis]ABZ75101.1 conserved hypothetical protein [Shewanella halifaxensis HAW-EB4]
MTINEIITLIKDIVLGLCALGTVSVAVYGVKNWARELKGKADFEVSRQLIRAVYKFRDEIEYSRSPMTLPSEFPANYDPMNRAAKYKAESWSYVFSNRWKPVVEAVQELEVQGLEAEALWGAEIKQLVQELRKNARLLRVGMQAVVDNEMQDNENFKCNSDLGKTMKNRVWKSMFEENDEITVAINSTVEKLENYVRPHLKRN